MLENILSLFFSFSCMNCRAELSCYNSLCADCFNKITLNNSYFNVAESTLLFSAVSYNYKAVKILLHSAKYKRTTEDKNRISKLINNYLLKEDIKSRLSKCGGVLAVPHMKSIFFKHSHLSDFIARTIAVNLGIPLLHGLVKKRTTPKQTNLSRKERLINLDGAFEWIGSKLAPGKYVLADDVFSTGSTMNECRRTIARKNSDTEIYYITFAENL